MSEYYFGHGRIWAAPRLTTGLPGVYEELAEPATFSISLARESVEHISKSSALAVKDLKVTRYVSATGTLTVSGHTLAMLKRMVFGGQHTVAGGGFVDQALPSGLVVGDIVAIPGFRKFNTAIVVKDSNGSPATLTLGTHYEIVDADAGLIKILNLASFTQPFTVSGTEAAGAGVSIFTQRQFEQTLLFKGINIALSDKPIVAEFYRVDLEPASEWQFLNDGNEVNSYEIPFELLRDTTKASNATFGQFGFYKEATA